MDNSLPQTATAVNYIPLLVPSIEDLTSEKLSEIVVSAQGEAVEIMDTREFVSAMKIFHFLYKFSSECIYRTLKNNRYLLFDHQSIPVIRDGDIVNYWVEDRNVTSQSPIIPHVLIDVEDLWNRTNGNEFDRTKQLLGFLQDQQRAEEVTLTGSAPTLVFLFVQEFFEGSCKSLFYQKTNNVGKITVY